MGITIPYAPKRVPHLPVTDAKSHLTWMVVFSIGVVLPILP